MGYLNNYEIPIQKGLKAVISTSEIALNNFTFDKAGTQKIMVSAYGKQADMTFVVRSPRTFEVIKIPIVFHISSGAGKENEANYQAFLQNLKNGSFIDGLNKIFRNSADVSTDPNAVDTFIEFYLLEKDANGVSLKQAGINFLEFTKPIEATKDYTEKLNTTLKTWNPNFCLNVFFFLNNAYGFNSASGNAVPTLWDISRKNLISSDFFQLPLGAGTVFSTSSTNSPYVELRSAFVFSNFQTLLAHEVGHILGLQHTFLSGCTNINFHSDGLYQWFVTI